MRVAIVRLLMAAARRRGDDHLAPGDALHLSDDCLCLVSPQVFQHLAAQDNVKCLRAEGQKPHVAADHVLVQSRCPAVKQVGPEDVRPIIASASCG